MKQLFDKVKGLFGATSLATPVADSAEENLVQESGRIVSVAGESYLVGVRETKKTRVNIDDLLSCRTGVSDNTLQYISDYQFELSCNGHKKVTWNEHYGPTDQELVEFVIDAYSSKELIMKGKEGLIARASSLPPPTKDIVLAMFSSLGSGRFSAYDSTLKDRVVGVWYSVMTSPGSRALNPTLEVKSLSGKTGIINLTNEEMDYIEKLIEWFRFYGEELNKVKAKRKEHKKQWASNTLRKQLSKMYGEENDILQ